MVRTLLALPVLNLGNLCIGVAWIRSRRGGLTISVLASEISRITAVWAEQKAVREIMVFLHSHGVGTARAVRIYKTYGPDAIQVMTEVERPASTSAGQT